MKRKTLSPGTELEPYFVKHEVEQDYFGVTYVVQTSTNEDQRFQIREFFPSSLSRRRKGEVLPIRKKLNAEFEAARDKCEQVFERLKDANISGMVSVRDRFVAHNTHYVVSEWPEGETLAELLQEHGEFTPEQVRGFLDLVLPALTSLEDHGIVHSGLSPMMIYRDSNGQPIINMPHAPSLAGELPIVAYETKKKSKPDAYIAPELLKQSESAAPITHAADVYSLCALAYTQLTGRAPAPAIDRIAAKAEGAADPIDMDALHNAAGDDTELLVVISRGLSLEPEDRFQTLTALGGFLAPAIPVEPAKSESETDGSGKKRFPLLIWASAAVVFLGIVLTWGYFSTQTDSEGEVMTAAAEETPVETADTETVSPDDVVAQPIVARPPSGTLAESGGVIEDPSPASLSDLAEKLVEPAETLPVAEPTTPNIVEAAASVATVTTTTDQPLGDEASTADLPVKEGIDVNVTNATGTVVEAIADTSSSIDIAESDVPTTELDRDAPLADAIDAAAEETVIDEPKTPFEVTTDLIAAPAFRDCDDCSEFQPIKAGGFYTSSKTPVTVEKPFAIMTSEVTRGDYLAFLRATGKRGTQPCLSQSPSDPSVWSDGYGANVLRPGFEQSADHPVVCVSWEDAKSYAGWMSQKTGVTYRLPTSAEWAYAARAGQDTTYSWGDGHLNVCGHDNIADISLEQATSSFTGNVSCADGHERTSPVGAKSSNPAGLQGLAGNVAEWVEDCGAAGCSSRLVKGSSWAGSLDQARPDWSRAYQLQTRHNTIGFRLVREDEVN